MADLNAFLMDIRDQLSESFSHQNFLSVMRDNEITLADIARMKRDDLYSFVDLTFKDANAILKSAKTYCNKSTPAQQKSQTPLDLNQLLKDMRPSTRNILCQNLDGAGQGTSGWEVFAEQLLQKSMTEIKAFSSAGKSPTTLVLEQKLAADPQTTVGDVVQVLEDITRKDIIQLMEEHVPSIRPRKQGSSDSTHSTHMVRQTSSVDSEPLINTGGSFDESASNGNQSAEFKMQQYGTFQQKNGSPVPHSRSLDAPSSEQSLLHNSSNQQSSKFSDHLSHSYPQQQHQQQQSSYQPVPKAHVYEAQFHTPPPPTPPPAASIQSSQSSQSSYVHYPIQATQTPPTSGLGYSYEHGVEEQQGFDPSQRHSLAMPQRKAVSDAGSEELSMMLKQLTIGSAEQSIQLTCYVYNNATRSLIPSIQSSQLPSGGGAVLLRDITAPPQPRLQEFASQAVPLDTSISLEISANSDCYLYVFNIGTSGKVAQLLPIPRQSNHYFKAGSICRIPDGAYTLQITYPPGKEVIQVLATSQPFSNLDPLNRERDVVSSLLRDITFIRKYPQIQGRAYGFARIEFTIG